MEKRLRVGLLILWAAVAGGAATLPPPWPDSLEGRDLTVEAQVGSYDAARGRLELLVSAMRPRGRAVRRLDPPTRATVLLGLDEGLVPARDPAGQPIARAALTPGVGVTLTFSLPGSRSIDFMPLGDLVVACEAPARPLPRSRQEGGEVARPPYTQTVSLRKAVVPMIFPVLGRVGWRDTFQTPRGGRLHLGQDLPAPRMRPLLAAFDGVAFLIPETPTHRGNTVTIVGDNGWQALYTHLNNDTPGTTDNRAGGSYAFAPGVRDGGRVAAGQFIGWVGDSGNATGPHLHFELRDSASGEVLNAAPSLKMAQRLAMPRLRRILPGLQPGRGEVRIDGWIRALDRFRNVLVLDLRAKTSRGRLAPVMSPATGYLKLGSSPDPRALGAQTVRVPMDDLAPGMLVAAVGRPSRSGAIEVREAHVEIRGLVVEQR